MITKVRNDLLEKLLRRGESVADKKASMAVLSMALLEFSSDDRTLHLTTTDLEQGFKGRITLEDVQGEGLSFCVPCKRFYDIVRNFPEEKIILVKEDSRLLIKDEEERIVFELATTEAEEFPTLPEFFEENLLQIPGRVLSELIESTIFCSSKEESRFVLGGVYLELLADEQKMRAVASDGHRLALLDREVEGLKETNLKEGFILAKKGAERIAEMAEEELVVRFGFVNNYGVLFTSDGIFFTRTIEGSFPDYRAVIPQTFENRLVVDRKLFLETLKRASLLIPERFKPVKLELTPAEITVSSPETEVGRARIKLQAEYQGSPLNINFNAEYLISALEIMKSEEVEIKMNDERSPSLITGFRDEGFLYLLMPMVI
ncbi:MAG: DNA polymerase III subunit beta [Caldimicrobium sp.]|nr:DNA polymerase III subunit beta [Caldimicrobium sp.]MCX7612749.1 DNA polymerase III subunit beta [Caldimicrobium sp.]MDW8183319.1 DNA polymerase III subunit beta [Caldimicrobium sp.]